MKRYQVALVDDDANRATALRALVEECGAQADLRTGVWASVDELAAAFPPGPSPDILLVSLRTAAAEAPDDFEGSKSGGGSLKSIDSVSRFLRRHETAQVIYVADGPELCTQVYRTPHVSFLVEPIDRADLERALRLAVANLNERVSRPFMVKGGGRIISVDPREVAYVESDRRKVRIHTTGGIVEVYESLGGILSKLPGSFVQCHKSFVVNMDKVAEMRADALSMRTGEVIPISQKRRHDTREAFAEHLSARR